QVSQARAAADNAEMKLDQTRQAAVRQIVRANNTLDSSLETWQAATALKAASQITFDAALEAYRNGVGTITGVHAAEIQLGEAENATADAYSGALSAAATLALATGALGSAP
ncbi:TolC family protein, partial [Dokdonella sp.]|uniref:TolC family protein n=1 Tax=Dokdonella sp. TaxID=2291710 RepID=UPI003C52407C